MSCVRGCIQPRRHLLACEDEVCRGCLPEPATNGDLCYSCHVLLLDALTHAAGQVAMLWAVAEPSTEQALTVETASVWVGPRLDASWPHYIAPAGSALAGGPGEPVRLAAMDCARQLEDILSGWVETLATEHDLTGPPRLLSMDARRDARQRRWMPTFDDGTPRSRLDPVVVRHDERGQVDRGQYVWVDPPARFEVAASASWLRRNLLAVERMAGIADEMDALTGAMGQAHSVAPWRRQMTRLRGIPCPHCHAMALVLFGGMSDVTCNECGKRFPWSRYQIWIQMYQAERTPA